MSKGMAVENVAGSIEALRCRLTEARERFSREELVVAEGVKEIKADIANGGATSGDPVTDYILVVDGVLEREAAQPFREVEKRMVSKKGELFLVVEREEGQHKSHGCSGGVGALGSDFYLSTRRILGVLSGEKLVLDLESRSHGLPAKEFVEVSANRPLNKRPGPFIFIAHRLHELGRTVCAGRDSGPALEVIIGNAAVFKYSPHPLWPIGARDWIVARNKAARILR